MGNRSSKATSGRQVHDSLVWIAGQFPDDPIDRLVAVLESGRLVPVPVASPLVLVCADGALRESEEKVLRYLRGRRDGMTAKAVWEGMEAEALDVCLSAVEKALRRLKIVGLVKNDSGEWIAVQD